MGDSIGGIMLRDPEPPTRVTVAQHKPVGIRVDERPSGPLYWVQYEGGFEACGLWFALNAAGYKGRDIYAELPGGWKFGRDMTAEDAKAFEVTMPEQVTVTTETNLETGACRYREDQLELEAWATNTLNLLVEIYWTRWMRGA